MEATKLAEFNVHADKIIAIGADGVHYFWQTQGDYIARMSERHAYEAAHDHKIQTTTIIEVHAEYDTDSAWIFAVADCFDPPRYLVFGKSLEDAHETFCTECERLIAIDDADLPDYGEDYHVNDNGTAVDTESIHFTEVRRIIVECPIKPAR